MNAELPSQRWALPSDSLYDKHYNEFENWVNDIYKNSMQYTEYGLTCTFDEALVDEHLFDTFIAERNAARYE